MPKPILAPAPDLSRDGVIAAALAWIDAHGLERFSVRARAAEGLVGRDNREGFSRAQRIQRLPADQAAPLRRVRRATSPRACGRPEG